MVLKALLLAAALSASSLPLVKPGPKKTLPPRKIAAGKFESNWDSLVKNYQTPDWFRDAKFGIWAHWSAQCQPENGDWYARQMYMQGSAQYDEHLKQYGHPSVVGFKDIDNAWHAEHWNPEKLMKLYKAAGAKYFVALANHHDNFDNYDSTYQEWNSLRVGPHKDLIAGWEKAARAEGLRFGVSNHSAHSWHWFQTAYGYDPEGPKAGQRYDGWLTKADGKGKWWEGLDPQELYTGVNMAPPDGIKTIKEMDAWHEKYDRVWDELPPSNNAYYTDKWFLRTQELMDKYHPDLIYFDNMDLPLGQTGLDIAAHYYNANMTYHQGHLEAVINVKDLKPERRHALVEDYERGSAKGIMPDPWQTDTCIGSWHYDRSIFEHHAYKTVKQVIHTLVDTVSRNGNLLLSIPVRGDGTLDEDELKFLKGMSEWMAVNQEAIFGSRPWKVYGEGPVKPASGMFNEGPAFYTSRDFRFTVKGAWLYATAMGLPKNGTLLLQSLAKTDGGNTLETVSLLGYSGTLNWKQDAEGVHVTLPAKLPSAYTLTLKIKGRNLVPLPAKYAPAQAIVADGEGKLILNAQDAELHGNGITLESKEEQPDLGYWGVKDWASWRAKFLKSGTYHVRASVASLSPRDEFVVEAGGQDVVAKIEGSGAWDKFKDYDLGELKVDKAGEATVSMRPHGPADQWKGLNLRYLEFTLKP